MQELDNLKEIFFVMHEMGVEFHKEIISLRAKNIQLEKDYSELEKKFSELKADLNNISEKNEQLAKNISDEIIKELNVKDRENFQKFVEDYLRQIRKCVDGSIQSEVTKKVGDEKNNISENVESSRMDEGEIFS